MNLSVCNPLSGPLSCYRKKKPLKLVQNSYERKISLCTSRYPIIIFKICMNLSSHLLGCLGKIIDV